jgi:hypothetical protein
LITIKTTSLRMLALIGYNKKLSRILGLIGYNKNDALN